MLSATLETININLLSVEERYAFDILRNLPIDKLLRLKTLLKVDESQAIGRETLQKFLQLAKENRFDLTESGVNHFKEKHGLGNAPPWTTIFKVRDPVLASRNAQEADLLAKKWEN